MFLHQLFEQRSEQIFMAGEIRCGNDMLPYTTLNDKANALAHVLIDQGMGSGKTIGIFLDRSIEMVIAMLAILKAGSCYVPVEPGFPKERIDFILEDSQAALVISSRARRSILGHDNVLLIDETDTASLPATNPNINIADSSLAYIIYTSGTTGKPKGTMIEHRNVVEVLTNSSGVLDFKQDDSWICVHSICFDFSVWEIFGALLFGNCLTIVPKEVVRNVVTFVDVLKKGATILSLTPTAFYSMMDYLVQEEDAGHFELRYVILGGEAVSPARFKEWENKFPTIRLINGYGVTETAIFFSFKQITKELIESNISNIGKPIPGLNPYILDTEMKSVPGGESGELFIGGRAVGRGYINQPVLHAKHFVPDPFNPGALLYRTGDIVRQLPGGEMEYIGRLDNQVKIRGYRIELGEIEKNIYGFGGIRNTVVTVFKSPAEELYITAYVVSDNTNPGFVKSSDSEEQETRLKEYLATKLPEYMIPYYVVFLDEIPVTNSGKADKDKLPLPQPKEKSSANHPRTNEEKVMISIWSEVLGIGKELIGVDTSFFDLGGHSLLLTRLSAEIFYRFGVRIPIEELFSDPTVEKLAIYLKQPVSPQQIDANSGVAMQTDQAEVSAAQRVMFWSNKLNPSEAFPNSAISYELLGDIEFSRLQESFQKVIAANDGLRTEFYMEKGKVLSRICNDFTFEIQRIKSFRLEIDEEIIALTRPFDFGKSPLIRVYYIELGADRKFIHVDMPHINSDGVSLEVIISGMAAYYNERPYTPTLQFSDFQQYYHSYLGSDQYTSDHLFWQEHFDSTIPELHFKAKESSMPVDFSGVSLIYTFPTGLSERLNKYLHARNITKFQLLLAAYFLFIRRITSEDDISVMIPLQNRSVRGFDRIVGLLANRSVIRLKMQNENSIKSFIDECKASVLQAVYHTAYPFEQIFDHGTKKGQRYRKPLYQTFFNYHNHQTECMLGKAALKLHIHNKAKEILPLSVDVFDMGTEHIIRMLSTSGIYSKAELRNLTTTYFEVLDAIITNDQADLQSLSTGLDAYRPELATW